MAWSLISPASRGIGFSLTRYVLQNTQLPVIATSRKDVAETKHRILKDLTEVDPDRLKMLPLDVTDESSIIHAAAEAKSLFPPPQNHLHLAFCIPGILHAERTPAQIEQTRITEMFATNTIGPILMFKHFSQFLPAKRASIPPLLDASLPQESVWMNMSARVGSITDNRLGGWYSYRASKAALNSATKSFDLFLQNRCGDKAMAISYHPGTVKTDLSKDFWSGVPAEKLFSPEFAVEKMWHTVTTVGLAGRGKCFDWKKEVILP
ncbi:hypothetical protein K3495_g1850 [Podosphaera aphanis]|nr:hypothetical protein K3495_g1850 [Podosphaera aphanis]